MIFVTKRGGGSYKYTPLSLSHGGDKNTPKGQNDDFE
jgi:hypothetical protein